MANFITTVENDLKAAWTDTVDFVESDALLAWDTVKVVFLALLPGQYNILLGLITTLEADILAGDDIQTIEQALVMKAEEQELTWVTGLGSAILQALIAIFKANASTATTVGKAMSVAMKHSE